MTTRKAIFVIGGTGMGKTKLGVQLAEAFAGEVVNSDAMQMYRALPIATAQPTEQEKQSIPHHLMGILDSHEAWTVRDYRDSALKIMQDIWSRGKTPIVVGGTLYYVQSLIWKALSDEQPQEECSSPKRQCKDAAASETLFETLQRLDPERAAQLHPNDARKIQRSLELLEETGGGAVSQSTNQTDQVRMENCRIFWVNCDNEEETQNILSKRVEEMFKTGLEREVDDFMRENEETNMKRGVFQAIGIRNHDQLVVHHRQYVKSQLKWIRKRILPRTVPVHQLSFAKREEWDDKVGRVGLDIARAFLNGDDGALQQHKTCNTTGTENAHQADTKIARTCEVCGNRVLVGDDAWNKHIDGRSHRNLLRKQQRLRRQQQTTE